MPLVKFVELFSETILLLHLPHPCPPPLTHVVQEKVRLRSEISQIYICNFLDCFTLPGMICSSIWVLAVRPIIQV